MSKTNAGEETPQVSEQGLKNLYNGCISYSFAIKEAMEMYSYRVLDLNQFVTRTIDLSDDFHEFIKKETQDGNAKFDFAARKVSQDDES